MADRSVRYTPDFKRQMVELVRAGRTPASLAKEFGPTASTISTWVKQDGRDAVKGDGGLTSAERGNSRSCTSRRLKEEREILSKAAAWLCVQTRWTCSVGNKPTGGIVRTP